MKWHTTPFSVLGKQFELKSGQKYLNVGVFSMTFSCYFIYCLQSKQWTDIKWSPAKVLCSPCDSQQIGLLQRSSAKIRPYWSFQSHLYPRPALLQMSRSLIFELKFTDRIGLFSRSSLTSDSMLHTRFSIQCLAFQSQLRGHCEFADGLITQKVEDSRLIMKCTVRMRFWFH